MPRGSLLEIVFYAARVTEEVVKENGVLRRAVSQRVGIPIFDNHRILQLGHEISYRGIQPNLSLLNKLQSCDLHRNERLKVP